MDIGAIRKNFPVTERYAYLNHASIGPLPRSTAEAMQHFLEERSLTGGLVLEGKEGELIYGTTRGKVARLINARQETEVTFVRNTSHGLNIIAAGLPWQTGDNVVGAETEFPANVYPWMNLKRKEVEVRLVKAVAGRIRPEDVAAAMDKRTRLVALSFVEFATGFRNDLGTLAEIAHRGGAFFCVDAIQGLGVFPVDVQKTPVDFLSAGSAKWLLGPVGFGLLYIRQERLDELDLVMGGWVGVEDWRNFFRYDSPFRHDATRYEEGTIAPSLLLGLNKNVQMFLDLGVENISRRVLDLTAYLIEGLKRLGLTVITPHASEVERSGIVSFLPSGDPAVLAARLRQEGVIISQRGNFIRVSPHFYNTNEELDRALAIIGNCH